MSGIDFWKVKHLIDCEVNRLKWSKDDCKAYLVKEYGKDSRLRLTDKELLDLLDKLRNLNHIKIIQPVSRGRKTRRRKRNLKY